MRNHDPHAPDEQGFIPGIFNYCDRWCEKCRFVRQCRVGFVEADEVRDDEEADVASEKVEGAHERFERMMNEWAELQDADQADDGEEEGLDFDPVDFEPSPEEEEAYAWKRERVKAAVEAHPLTALSRAYMELCSEWLDARREDLAAMGIRLDRRAGQQWMPLSPERLVLKEAVEEVAWFMTMLPVKTNRCISGKVEDPGFMERIGLDPLMSDENGTAKLVLHIIERCRTAWTAIAEAMPDARDAAVPVLELLRRHEAIMRAEFPDAERFIRPGFDGPQGAAR